MAPRRGIRIGIDVGGTFTHAVAIDAATLDIVATAKLPTTHTAAEGVARGVVEALRRLLDLAAIRPEEVLLIAHSTTQATNALLEGDVAAVGIIGMGGGAGGALARRQTAIAPIPLAPGRHLATSHRFIPADRVSEATVERAIDELLREGAQVFVAADAFSVDDPAREERVCEVARRRGLPVTATHHVSRLHGLGVRTRTAVVNAAMIPKMLSTADHTERAVREAGIAAPLMIMRSDGGIMSIEEMRRRPILTILSGPAAGVAAALLYARISDGLFLDVGGTSTDISAIRNGRTQIRSAQIGGNRLFVSTLDVRTVGLAGGSAVYVRDGAISQIGPRSAHIAGLPYLSFSDADPDGFVASTVRIDTEEYLTVTAGEETLAVTPTCASNRLGLVPDGDCARGRDEAIRRGLDLAAARVGLNGGEALAREILAVAVPKVTAVLEALIRDYKLDRGVIRLIAGGGGGAAVVPHAAQRMGMPFESVANADIISAIGVALALVRDSIERTVIQPTDEDIRRVREEAIASVLRMGAAPDTVEVFVEVDATRNLLRATAEGSTEIREQELRAASLTPRRRIDLVTASIGASMSPPRRVAEAAGFEVWSAPRVVPRLWKFFPETRTAVRVLDAAGAIRWASNHGDARVSCVAQAGRDLEAFAETHTRYSDAGATIPRCYVLLEGRIVDLSGLVEIGQAVSILQMELARHAQGASCVLLLDRGG